jgi:hypothetical protein
VDAIPVYVVSFNQPTYLRNMVRQLRALDVPPDEIHIVDNASTSPPLIDYLDELAVQGHQVHRLPRNFGPHVVFNRDAQLALPPTFAVTDPDLQFHADMPRSFRSDMAAIARSCGSWKCGCALTIDDGHRFLPGPYYQGRTIREWESAFWAAPLGPAHAAGTGADPVYRAIVDTTFAVYLRDGRGDNFWDAVRVAGRYEARHLPWYIESYALPSGPSGSNGRPPHLDDGRVMVRPGPCEVDRYRGQASGSTTALLAAVAGTNEYLEVECPEDGYTFAVAPWTAHASWWRERFAAGSRAPTFRMLRELTTSTRGPTHLIDIGASCGRTALWASLRCDHVTCVEADAAALQELRDNVAVNRAEHCVTVVPGKLSDRDAGDAIEGLTIATLCSARGVPLDAGNLIINCDVGGGEAIVLGDLLAFAARNARVVGGLLCALHKPRWTDPASFAERLQRTYARHPDLAEWAALSAQGEPLAGVAGVVRYADENPRGSVSWRNPDGR